MSESALDELERYLSGRPPRAAVTGRRVRRERLSSETGSWKGDRINDRFDTRQKVAECDATL